MKPDGKYWNRAFGLVIWMIILCAISSCATSVSDAALRNAEALIHGGEFDEAIRECDIVIIDDPENPHAYRIRGDAHAEKGDFRSAVTDYSKAIELDSEYYLAIGSRGSMYGCIGENEKAIEDFTVMVDEFPDDPFNWYIRGVTYMQLEKWDEAISDLEKTLTLDPSHDRAQAKLTEAKLHSG